MSKGSDPRPLSIPKKEFDKRWDEIFKKNENKKRETRLETNTRTA